MATLSLLWQVDRARPRTALRRAELCRRGLGELTFRRPEETVLYRVVQEHLATFLEDEVLALALPNEPAGPDRSPKPR